MLEPESITHLIEQGLVLIAHAAPRVVDLIEVWLYTHAIVGHSPLL
jgi:hypothetical protein